MKYLYNCFQNICSLNYFTHFLQNMLPLKSNWGWGNNDPNVFLYDKLPNLYKLIKQFLKIYINKFQNDDKCKQNFKLGGGNFGSFL